MLVPMMAIQSHWRISKLDVMSGENQPEEVQRTSNRNIMDWTLYRLWHALDIGSSRLIYLAFDM